MALGRPSATIASMRRLAEGAARLLVAEHIAQRDDLAGQFGEVLLGVIDDGDTLVAGFAAAPRSGAWSLPWNGRDGWRPRRAVPPSPGRVRPGGRPDPRPVHGAGPAVSAWMRASSAMRCFHGLVAPPLLGGCRPCRRAAAAATIAIAAATVSRAIAKTATAAPMPSPLMASDPLVSPASLYPISASRAAREKRNCCCIAALPLARRPPGAQPRRIDRIGGCPYIAFSWRCATSSSCRTSGCGLSSKPVTRVDADIRKLVADMFETMYEAPGIGLAAIQVGVPLRLVIMDLSKRETRGRAQGLPQSGDPLVVVRNARPTRRAACRSRKSTKT